MMLRFHPVCCARAPAQRAATLEVQYSGQPRLRDRRIAKSAQTLREQFEEYRASGRCTLIDGGKTSADQAALFNSGLVRYLDLLDSSMSQLLAIDPAAAWSEDCISAKS